MTQLLPLLLLLGQVLAGPPPHGPHGTQVTQTEWATKVKTLATLDNTLPWYRAIPPERIQQPCEEDEK